MSDLSSEQILGRLADQIHNPSPDTNQIPAMFMRFATVQSKAGFRAVIRFAGSTVDVPNARYLANSGFAAGDVVALIQYKIPNEETVYLILDRVA